jgi:hypothetical protein
VAVEVLVHSSKLKSFHHDVILPDCEAVHVLP